MHDQLHDCRIGEETKNDEQQEWEKGTKHDECLDQSHHDESVRGDG